MPKATDFRVLLVRSGETDWDLVGRLAGSTDLPLCDEGRRSVEDAAGALGDVAPRVILTAPDAASLETAEALSAATKAKVRKIDAFADIDMGLWEGLLSADLEERYPSAYRRWLEDPSTVSAPEGESFIEVEIRVMERFARAMEKLDKSERPAAAVVLRPFIYGVVRSRLLGDSPASVHRLAWDGASAEWHQIDRGRLVEIARTPQPETGAA
ncbi:MAG: histidine phosphatase family protein [Planctomycetota bacterium]